MAEDETPAEDATAEDATAEDATAEDTTADETTAEDATAETDVQDDAEPAAAPARPEPVEVLPPKERRRRRRAAKAPAARPPRSTAERQAERDDVRAKKAAARRVSRVKERSAKHAGAVAATPSTPVEHAAGRPKVRQGVVVSSKADKTITVRVDTSRRHRRYKKIVRLSKTLHAHDEHNDAHEGDLVRVIETRPLSATKRWRLAEILERAR